MSKLKIWNPNNIKITCQQCWMIFEVFPFRIKQWNWPVFCSQKCHWLFNRNKSHNDVWRKKTSDKLKWRIITREWRDKISKSLTGRLWKTAWNKWKKMPLSFSINQSKNRVWENSAHWKGWLTPENKRIRHAIEYRLWRESVFARDNWTCQKTWQIGGKLRCHHIKNFAQYPELRFAIDNGITLSHESHKEFHKIYGIKNNTQEQLNQFLDKTKW